MAIERDRFDEVRPAPAAAPTATHATEFGSIALQTKLRAAVRAGTLRQAWRLSDGREVLLTAARCHVAERHSGKVWSAPFPMSAGEGLAVQCVMATAPGCDPFSGGGEEKKR